MIPHSAPASILLSYHQWPTGRDLTIPHRGQVSTWPCYAASNAGTVSAPLG